MRAIVRLWCASGGAQRVPACEKRPARANARPGPTRPATPSRAGERPGEPRPARIDRAGPVRSRSRHIVYLLAAPRAAARHFGSANLSALGARGNADEMHAHGTLYALQCTARETRRWTHRHVRQTHPTYTQTRGVCKSTVTPHLSPALWSSSHPWLLGRKRLPPPCRWSRRRCCRATQRCPPRTRPQPDWRPAGSSSR